MARYILYLLSQERALGCLVMLMMNVIEVNLIRESVVFGATVCVLKRGVSCVHFDTRSLGFHLRSRECWTLQFSVLLLNDVRELCFSNVERKRTIEMWHHFTWSCHSSFNCLVSTVSVLFRVDSVSRCDSLSQHTCSFAFVLLTILGYVQLECMHCFSLIGYPEPVNLPVSHFHMGWRTEQTD